MDLNHRGLMKNKSPVTLFTLGLFNFTLQIRSFSLSVNIKLRNLYKFQARRCIFYNLII